MILMFYRKLQMELKLAFKKCILICSLLTGTGFAYFAFFGPDQMYSVTFNTTKWPKRTFSHERQKEILKTIATTNAGVSFQEIIGGNIRFDMNSHDVIVFLHIQKTGGTSFGKHLVQDLDLQRPCSCQRKIKRCYCFRPSRNENWLFSRYSIGWKCGLHADWTELTNCVNSALNKNDGTVLKRRYFYITLLREPTSRYLSEFKHVQRGATWRNSRHWCGGRSANPTELTNCYNGSYWKDVTLDQFLNCTHNLATNRQVRMTCDLSLVGCYNDSYMTPKERSKVILASAKHNLETMAFFSLMEHQKMGQYIFEQTFNLRFTVPFTQHNSTRTGKYMSDLTKNQIMKLRQVNSLDIELYQFAEALLFRRFDLLRKKDEDFDNHWKHLGELQYKSEFNWDKEIEPDVYQVPNTRR